MFLRRLPISVENTLTPIPKHHASPSSPRYQTHRYPSLPVVPNLRSRGIVLASPNVAVEVQGESSDGPVGSRPSREPEPLPPELRPDLIPKHVAVIMDGNGRWAKMRGLSPSAGHEAGVKSLRRIIELCCSWGIKVLTVFAFSYDNWVRPKVEVEFLMNLFERTISTEIDAFKSEGIRISVIGDTTKLPETLQRMIKNSEESTKENSLFQLIVAVSYSGKYDVVQACKAIAEKVKEGAVEPEDISESLIEKELETSCTEFPNPDLMIRTSGELRVSNFLLWQLAYTELVFDPALWPDFGKQQFVEALASFQQRQRRFGGRNS
ncbi:dehydrodolichyl diphosphate synthase 2-like [Prosopis cineraria]|uniref:dehydrodolichyl diphosphate synthase 2-like n=1 Tax=Prosopis cineraria TaxID=364024 RepID=UPI00240F3F6E|nr:dehydrodolichyl diphosphate synthase 2-like [Prosopis cineraria]